MKQLQQLINQMCPNGVVWKKLGEVCEKVSSGGTPNTKKANYYNGNIPWLRTQEVDFCDITDTGIKITNEGLENSSAKWIPANCVIIAMYGATVGKVAINKIPLTTNQACCNLEINDKVASYRFVYYCLENQYNYIKSLGQGSQTNINAQIVKQLLIPLPPLAIQNRIVEILDNFTNLTANLTAEFALRRKQFEYYREKLLSLDGVEGVILKKLGEVASIYDGTHQTPKYTQSGIPFISVENIRDIYNSHKYISREAFDSYKIKPLVGDVFMTRIGSIGECAVFDKQEDIAYYVSLALIRPKECINSCYVKYLLESNIGKSELRKRTLVSAVPIKINKDDISKIQIPVPPLATQQSIVSILDKFTALIENIETELSLRQKQYEYYREQLLTFKS